MYNEYFGLTDRPFSIAPDPRYLYMSDHHREALAHLTYGVQQEGGFILLTGEVGTGKTTVCRCFLKQLNNQIDVAYIVNPKQTSIELLGSMCDDLGIERTQSNDSIKSLTDVITRRLLDNHANGKNTVLLIDEAQNLSVEVLEQLRLLTNLETDQKKLLQIILLGQPELLDLLAKPELRQLSQRVTARFHMDKLAREDIIPYVQHRLAVAGCRMSLFPKSTAKVIESASNGVPRLINLICDRALLGVYSRNESTVSVQTLKQAAKEVLGEQKKAKGSTKPSYFWTFASIVLVFQCLAVLTWLFYTEDEPILAETQSYSIDSTSKKNIGEVRLVENALVENELIQNKPVERNDESFLSKPEDQPTAVKSALRENASQLNSVTNLASYFNDKAYALLAERWGIKGLPNHWPVLCEDLAKTRITCDSGNYEWQKFISINRPAVATLIYQGQVHRALVSAVDKDPELASEPLLTLVASDGSLQQMGRSLFEQLWTGKLEFLWLQPSVNMPVLRLGDVHGYIQVVRAFLQGQPGSSVYDSSLSNDIKRFQADHQIISDGVIGPETIMLINTLKREAPVLMGESVMKPNASVQSAEDVLDPAPVYLNNQMQRSGGQG